LVWFRRSRNSPDPYRDEKSKGSDVAVIRRGGPAGEANALNLKELIIEMKWALFQRGI